MDFLGLNMRRFSIREEKERVPTVLLFFFFFKKFKKKWAANFKNGTKFKERVPTVLLFFFFF